MQPTNRPIDGDDADRAFVALTTLFERLIGTANSSAMAGVTKADLTFSQFRTLMELGARGTALSVNELADAVQLSVAAAGRVVDKLVGLGYTDRREDPADRRVKRVSLTAPGHAFVTMAVDARADAVRAFTRRLPSDVAHALTRALDPVVNGDIDYFTAPDPDPDPQTES